jgi:hypothetical protein
VGSTPTGSAEIGNGLAPGSNPGLRGNSMIGCMQVRRHTGGIVTHAYLLEENRMERDRLGKAVRGYTHAGSSPVSSAIEYNS